MLDRDELDEWLERGIAIVILGIMVLSALALGGVRNTEFSIIAGFAMLATSLWIVRFWVNPSHRFLLHPVIWPVLGFVAYAVWRHSQAVVPYVSRLELMHLFVYAAVLLIAIHNLHRQGLIQWVVIVLVVLGTVLSFYALIQLATGSDKVLWFTKPENYVRRGGATFVNPNHLAGFLVAIIPLAICQLFMGRWSALVRVFFGYASLAMLAGIAVTMSRGGWLALGASLGALLVWLIRRPQYRIPAIAGVLIVALGAWFYFKNVDAAQRRLKDVASHGVRDSGQSRKYLLGPTWMMFIEHPVTGVGPGHFDTAFPAYRPVSIQLAPGWAHNEYLQLLAEYGAIGGLLVATGLGLLGWGIAKTSKFAERGSNDLGFKASNRSAFFMGASIGIAGVLVHSIVEFNLHIPGIALPLVVIVGVLASTLRFATDNFWVTPTWWARGLVTALGIAFVAWTAPHSIRAFREGLQLNDAAKASEIDEPLLSKFRSAIEIEPSNPRSFYELGENLRLLSWRGLPGYEEQAREAIRWLQRSAELNPFDPYPHLRMALCHHWLGQKEDARKSFDRARDLGPNDVTIANHYGWSLILRGELDKAREVLVESLRWNDWNNWMARHYLEMVETMLRARTTGSQPAP